MIVISGIRGRQKKVMDVMPPATERLPLRVKVRCMVNKRNDARCKNRAKYAIRVADEMETLVCGVHRKYLESHEGEFDGFEDFEENGVRLKKIEEPPECGYE